MVNPKFDLEIVIARERKDPRLLKPRFYGEIAAHLAGARNDLMRKGLRFLNRESGLERGSSRVAKRLIRFLRYQ